jgi:hypothetical protein
MSGRGQQQTNGRARGRGNKYVRKQVDEHDESVPKRTGPVDLTLFVQRALEERRSNDVVSLWRGSRELVIAIEDRHYVSQATASLDDLRKRGVVNEHT